MSRLIARVERWLGGAVAAGQDEGAREGQRQRAQMHHREHVASVALLPAISSPRPVATGFGHGRYHSNVPNLRPFRALRFDAAASDLSTVLAPPYDIISPAERQELLARDPHNIVRIELPADLGAARPEDYAAAATTVAEWRKTGVLVKDDEPTVTVHQMRWVDTEGRRTVGHWALVPAGPRGIRP